MSPRVEDLPPESDDPRVLAVLDALITLGDVGGPLRLAAVAEAIVAAHDALNGFCDDRLLRPTQFERPDEQWTHVAWRCNLPKGHDGDHCDGDYAWTREER